MSPVSHRAPFCTMSVQGGGASTSANTQVAYDDLVACLAQKLLPLLEKRIRDLKTTNVDSVKRLDRLEKTMDDRLQQCHRPRTLESAIQQGLQLVVHACAQPAAVHVSAAPPPVPVAVEEPSEPKTTARQRRNLARRLKKSQATAAAAAAPSTSFTPWPVVPEQPDLLVEAALGLVTPDAVAGEHDDHHPHAYVVQELNRDCARTVTETEGPGAEVKRPADHMHHDQPGMGDCMHMHEKELEGTGKDPEEEEKCYILLRTFLEPVQRAVLLLEERRPELGDKAMQVMLCFTELWKGVEELATGLSGHLLIPRAPLPGPASRAHTCKWNLLDVVADDSVTAGSASNTTSTSASTSTTNTSTSTQLQQTGAQNVMVIGSIKPKK